jgi:hypothetical protein
MPDLTALTALALRRRGLSVIPVPRPRAGAEKGTPGDGKVPAIRWREYQERLATETELANWFGGEPMNLAIVTGAISDVVVIDCDSPAAMAWAKRRLPYTPWQTKTIKGYHLFYRHPGVRITNRSHIETQDGKLSIDVRGDGGFVVVAPSHHAALDDDQRVTGTDGTYSEAGDWRIPRDRIPRFWPGWIARPTRPSSSQSSSSQPISSRPATRSPPDLLARARKYLDAIPRPEIGAGSDTATLCAACKILRGFGLNHAETEDLLWAWAGNRAGWTRAWIAEKVRNAHRYGSEPHGALR